MSDSSVMKAWQYDKFGPELEKSMFLNNRAQRIRTTLLPDEILVQVISAGLNPIDYKVAEMKTARLAISLPATPAADYCGRVVATGNAVDSLRNGELVFGRLEPGTQFGALGEYVIASLLTCTPLPKAMDIDDAAAIGTAGMTALQSIRPNVARGSKVFINGGSGGTGVFGIQVAKALGCVVTTSCSTAKVTLCKELGADEVIDYQSCDMVQKLKGEGLVYDLVVDNAGIPGNLYVESTHFLRETGKYVQIAADSSFASIGSIASRLLKPSFMGGGKRKYQFLSVKSDANDLTQLGDWVQDGKLKVVIDTAFEYADAAKAYERLKSGQVKGKVIVHVGEK